LIIPRKGGIIPTCPGYWVAAPDVLSLESASS
jgi:hypothetical protein